jgi:hypothetical protein
MHLIMAGTSKHGPSTPFLTPRSLKQTAGLMSIMKYSIIASLAAVALLSLSACTTANDERSAPAYHPAPPDGAWFPQRAHHHRPAPWHCPVVIGPEQAGLGGGGAAGAVGLGLLARDAVTVQGRFRE